ncbi:MAG TPA: helix-turn-helix domain-containing protein, partial [Kineosporiaceae bacterium]|nr:helix-turn-helix domain-containing protein [Kineosporiaceae bacterium]
TDGFALQVREQAGEGDRRRQQLGQLLLGGSAPASVVTAAAAGIGWRGLDVVVPVLLPLDQARDARFRYSADGVVVERDRDAVLLLRSGPRTARAPLADALAGRRAVVGPALAWSQAPEGVRLAALAAELAGTGPVPVFADDHLAALALRGEPGALAVLAARRLAPFATVRDTTRDRLLQTLHSWLRHWGSRAEVSAELFVHPQTVSYRLKLLRELLGDDLDDADARFELLLVLAARSRTLPGPTPDGAPAA